MTKPPPDQITPGDGDGLLPPLPCPFCGNPPTVQNGDANLTHPYSAIRCTNDECIGPKTTAAFLDDAIFQWNTRATRDAAEGVDARDVLRSICKAGEELGCSCADQNYQWFDQGCKECIATAYKKLLAFAPPKPAPDAMREALEQIAARKPTDRRCRQCGYKFYGDGERHSEDCTYVIACKALAAPVPPADGALKACRLLLACLITKPAYHPGNVTIVEQPISASVYDNALAAVSNLSPSGAGAAEPVDDQDPPMKWLIEALRQLALLADPKTPWIGERDPKLHICWTAADRLATPPVRGDREEIARAFHARAIVHRVGCLKR